jgi:hypothetical protein
MTRKALLITCLSLLPNAFAVDNSFQLLKEGEQVNVYAKKPGACTGDGAGVLFVIENKTKERLELKMELLNVKVKNKLTVVVEPTGNTSVLSLSPDTETCHMKLVDMQVQSLHAPKADSAVTVKNAVPVL